MYAKLHTRLEGCKSALAGTKYRLGDVGLARDQVREWTNGNLHAVLEQTEAGHRLRLGTHKGNATEVTAIGAIFLVMALILVAIMAIGKTGVALILPALFALTGGGSLAWNFLRLPRWADERERQMEHIAGRARALLEAPPLEKDPET